MPGHPRFRWFGLAAVMLGITLLFVPQFAKPVQAAVVVIDTFNVTQTYHVDPDGSTGTPCVTGSASDIIGTKREVAITNLASPGAPNGTDVTVNSGGLGALGFSQASQVTSIAELTYDGDCTTGVNNPTGLGGADLTQAGTQYSIVVSEIAADLFTTMSIRVYTDATHCSILMQGLPSVVSTQQVPRAVIFLYTEFADDGVCPLASDPSNPSDGPADFTSVGAIQVIIDGTQNPAADVTLDFIQTPPMDFGDLPAGYPSGFPNYSAITTLPDGAAHIIVSTYHIGTYEDDECNGQPTGFASGDDNHSGFQPNSCTPVATGVNDDEDGVTGDGTDWTQSGAHSLTVVTTTPPSTTNGSITSGGGCLSVWINWSRDGDFTDTNEYVRTPLLVTGPNVSTVVNFSRPGFVVPGSGALYVRVRLFASLPGNSAALPSATVLRCPGSSLLPSDGQFAVGEVEDYRFLDGTPTAITLNSLSAKATKGDNVRVKWETGNELNVIGFNVWRKQGKAGWQQRNVNLIEAQKPGGVAGATYKFVDTGVRAKGKYKIQVELADGSTGWSDVVKVHAK